MRKVVFTGKASADLFEAQNWYERESTGLGQRFRVALDAIVERVRANPMQFPLIHRNVRRALIQQFPYALMFVIEPDDALTVIACFHGSRDPVRWQRRS